MRAWYSTQASLERGVALAVFGMFHGLERDRTLSFAGHAARVVRQCRKGIGHALALSCGVYDFCLGRRRKTGSREIAGWEGETGEMEHLLLEARCLRAYILIAHYIECLESSLSMGCRKTKQSIVDKCCARGDFGEIFGLDGSYALLTMLRPAQTVLLHD